jgi:hypothetical protein
MKSCHVLILTHFHPNFRTFKFTFGKLILGFFCIGVLLQMLQWGATSLYYMQNIKTTMDIVALQQGFNSFISDSKNKLQKLHGFIFKIHIIN